MDFSSLMKNFQWSQQNLGDDEIKISSMQSQVTQPDKPIEIIQYMSKSSITETPYIRLILFTAPALVL